MEKTESFFHNMTEYEVLKVNGNKRLIKRTFNYQGNKEPRTDYCIQSKFYVYNEERWMTEYYNNSKIKVERRFLGL